MTLVLINNEWVHESEAMVNLFSDAVMYGAGVFETCRTTPSRQVFKLDEHLDRLIRSAKQIRIPLSYSKTDITAMAEKVATASPSDVQKIKIIATLEDCIIISSELEIDESIYSGVAVKSVIQKRPLPDVKSLSYLECYLAYREAQDAGFFEALLTSLDGEVYEGSRSNLFWFDESGYLWTRKGEVLPGITRQTVMEISPFPVKYGTVELSKLIKKPEVFQTSSTRGIVPIVQLDDHTIGNGEPGPNTQELMKRYAELLI